MDIVYQHQYLIGQVLVLIWTTFPNQGLDFNKEKYLFGIFMITGWPNLLGSQEKDRLVLVGLSDGYNIPSLILFASLMVVLQEIL